MVGRNDAGEGGVGEEVELWLEVLVCVVEGGGRVGGVDGSMVGADGAGENEGNIVGLYSRIFVAISFLELGRSA